MWNTKESFSIFKYDKNYMKKSLNDPSRFLGNYFTHRKELLGRFSNDIKTFDEVWKVYNYKKLDLNVTTNRALPKVTPKDLLEKHYNTLKYSLVAIRAAREKLEKKRSLTSQERDFFEQDLTHLFGRPYNEASREDFIESVKGSDFTDI